MVGLEYVPLIPSAVSAEDISQVFRTFASDIGYDSKVGRAVGHLVLREGVSRT